MQMYLCLIATYFGSSQLSSGCVWVCVLLYKCG